MAEKPDRQEWLFRMISPLQVMRWCVILMTVFLCIAAASAVGWFFSRTANSTVTYDYKTVTPEEYLEKNGTSVLEYDKQHNQMAFMMTEDLINTMINRYLEEQKSEIGGYKIYEMVYRQKEGKFHIQMMLGWFRVPVKADVEALWSEQSQELVLRFSNARIGEDHNFWASWIKAPQIPEVRIPSTFLNLPDWQHISGIELNTNEMLLYLQPDLRLLASRAQENIHVDTIYLDWQNAMADSPKLAQRLGRIRDGGAVQEDDAADFLKAMMDEQQSLIPILAVSDQDSVSQFLTKFQAFLGNEVTLEACAKQRARLEQRVWNMVAGELRNSLQRYIASGIGTEPPALAQAGDSVDNSYVEFKDKARLEGTASVVQGESDFGADLTGYDPEKTFFTDAGVIYDYSRSAFVTPELIAELYPLTVDHVNFMDQIRFYYDAQKKEAAVLISGVGNDEVKVLTPVSSKILTLSQAQEAYPGYQRRPELAVVPGKDDPVRTQIIQALTEALKEGNVLSRYMSVSSSSAFVVFSTSTHAERIRSAVLSQVNGRWTVLNYDVSDYLEYVYSNPQINGTVFPLETIRELSVKTIPQAGLKLLLDKAVQMNLAASSETIDYYYYIGSYIYTHFSGGKQCVFQVDQNEAILACRSVESAAANWDLPPFFLLEASRP